MEFDLFLREVLSEVDLPINPLPEQGLLTDYFLDFKLFIFKPWREKCEGVRLKHPELYTPVPEVCTVHK